MGVIIGQTKYEKYDIDMKKLFSKDIISLIVKKNAQG